MAEDGGHEVVSGRYVLERELGRGGSAVVYLARDLHAGASVALKVLHQEFSGSRSAERFAQEIRLLERFEHPGILTVSDAGEWQGRPFYVMPYVDGETLQQRLRRERRLSFGEVVRIGQRLCEALAYAHAHKVVHRDVKPANVMLSGESVYLTDFGIAKALEPVGEAPHSTTGVARGTRAYMSPEQAAADRDLDHRSDIFSLGCVLYEMIAGQNPYQSADETRMLMRRMTDAPDPLSRHRDGVPAGLEAVVMKALAREPADRWQGVGEMGRGLGEGGGTDSLTRVPRISNARSKLALGAASLTVGAALWLLIDPTSVRDCELPELGAVGTPVVVVAAAAASGRNSVGTEERVLAGLREALSSWSNVRVQEASALGTWGDRVAGACLAARNGGHLLVAGRRLRSSSPDSIRLEVHAVGRGIDASVSVNVDTARTMHTVAWTQLVRQALAAEASSSLSREFIASATTLPAWRDCSSAWSLLERGELDSAALLFERSFAGNSNAGCSHLGLTVVTVLRRPDSAAVWRSYAVRALSTVQSPPLVARSLLESTILRADSRFEPACRQLRARLDERHADHLLATLLADCLYADSAVVAIRDGTRVFRTSWMEARRILTGALDVAPVGFEQVVAPRLSLVSPTSPTVRWGWVEGERTSRYAAYPAWDGDTLITTPLPRSMVVQSGSLSVPVTMGIAMREGKQLQVQVAAGWVKRAPASGDAHFALAQALEMIGRLSGDSSGPSHAIRELELANVQGVDDARRLRLLETRARVLLKAGQLRELVRIVDSALVTTNGMELSAARALAPLALLIGQVDRAIALHSRTLRTELPIAVSDALVVELAGFAILSAIGCCSVQLDQLERSLRSRLEVELDATMRERWSDRLLTRWLSLGASCRGWIPVTLTRDTTDAIVRIQQAFARGDSARARRTLRRLVAERERFGAGDIAIDYVVQEALVSRALGDGAFAKRQVETWLAALPVSSALELREVTQAAAVSRILRLGADMEAQLPETWRDSRTPSDALSALLERGDAWVRPRVEKGAFTDDPCRQTWPSSMEGT